MLTITGYTVAPERQQLTVEYVYTVHDPVANEVLERRAVVALDETVAPLNHSNWSDADLCVALARAVLNQDTGVTLVAPLPR